MTSYIVDWKKEYKNWKVLTFQILKNLTLFFIIIYRRILSGHFGGVCRFYPSCSEYAQTAFEDLNWPQAFRLFFRRFCRCHPLGGHGYDPVPANLNGGQVESRK